MSKQHSYWLTTNGFTRVALIAAVSYFLLVEHGEHLFQFLPYLILLLCPLMHIFMHHGHGHRDHKQDHTPDIKHPIDRQGDDYRRGYEEGIKQSKEKDER